MPAFIKVDKITEDTFFFLVNLFILSCGPVLYVKVDLTGIYLFLSSDSSQTHTFIQTKEEKVEPVVKA